MKKLSSESSNWEIIGTINDLIDEVMALDKVITRDIVRIATDDIIDALSEPADDTHRTVTLRIPKDTKLWVTTNLTEDEHFIEIGSFDTREEAQKALDEVQPNE